MDTRRRHVHSVGLLQATHLRTRTLQAVRERELTVTLIVLLIVVLVTQLPTASHAIYRLNPNSSSECGSVLRFLWSTADTLTVVNSAVNFLIYYPTVATFRRTLRSFWSTTSITSLASLRLTSSARGRRFPEGVQQNREENMAQAINVGSLREKAALCK